MRKQIEIAGGVHLQTLQNCGGYYSCPKWQNHRQGPLVGYAGTYDGPEGKKLQFVGDVYANFAKAEVHANVLRYFAGCLANQIDFKVHLANVDVFCGAPIGGYSLTDALGLRFDNLNIRMIKAEKKVTALKTATSREKSELVFARHSVEQGDHVVIIEDVCNNFSTTAEFIKLIMACGGDVIAIACFLNRSLTIDREVSLTFPGGAISVLTVPVVSLVRLLIHEWKQDDPAVADDIAKGNVVWKLKDEWDRLMEAMQTHPELTLTPLAE